MNKNWKYLNLQITELKNVKAFLEEENEIAAYKELVNYFMKRKKPGFIENIHSVLSILPTYDVKKFVTKSKELTQQTYIFNKPWDMEKCFEPIHFSEEINWHYHYHGDEEWMFMLNRQNFLQDLVVSYSATKDSVYLNAYIDFLASWQESESDFFGRQKLSWRTIDTGIRLKNWVKQLEYLLPQGCLSGEFILNTLGSIWKQIHYLLEENQFVPYLSQSNWRVLEFHGAYIASTFFPEIIDTKKWRKLAKRYLEMVLPLQVTPGGFQWEQSFMYHHEVFLNALEAYQVGQLNQDDFSDLFKEKLLEMLQASTHLATPQFKQPAFGDSDVEDLREITTLGTLILKPKTLNTFTVLSEPTLSLILDYGTNASEELNVLNKKIQKDTTLDFEHEFNGFYFVRNKWSHDANYILFANGYSGGGHGHSDLLHFELHSNGEPVLVDSGRYTYTEGNPKRQYFKDAKRHNTLTIDNKEFIQQKGSWSFEKLADPIKRPVQLNDEFVFLQGSHLGYGPESFINRKLLHLKEENITFIFDEILTEKKQTYQQHFHFATSSVIQKENKFYYQTKKNNFLITSLDNQKGTLLNTEISPDYNQLQETKKLVFEKKQTGPTHLGLLLADEKIQNTQIRKVPVSGKKNQIFDDQFISGYHFKTEKNEYLLVTLHFELPQTSRNLFMIEGIPVFGKTVICKKIDGQFYPYILEG